MDVLYQQTPNPDDLKKKEGKKRSGQTAWIGSFRTTDQATPDVERLKKIEKGKKQNATESTEQKK
jgi:hypothetical protein